MSRRPKRQAKELLDLFNRKRPKRQAESNVRTEIMDYLDGRPDCYAFVVRNTAPFTGGRFVRTPKGFKKGVSDIICFTNWGKTYLIETKGPKTPMSHSQRVFRSLVEGLNHPAKEVRFVYVLARKLEDVKEVFE